NLTDTFPDSIQESANGYDEYKKAQNEILDDMETKGVSNNEETTTHGNHFSESNINKDIKEPVGGTSSRRVPNIENVGQVQRTYIIEQNENSMYMINQQDA